MFASDSSEDVMIDDWNTWFDRLDDGYAVHLRPMRSDDLDEILRAIRLHDTDDYRAAGATFEEVDFGPPHDRVCYLVAETEDDAGEVRPVGVSGYYIDDLEARGVYWINWTYVNPFFQGEGIGSALLGATLETLRELGARKVFVSTSSLESYEAAVALYERHEFTLEGRLEDYYAPGEDQLILGRSL